MSDKKRANDSLKAKDEGEKLQKNHERSAYVIFKGAILGILESGTALFLFWRWRRRWCALV